MAIYLQLCVQAAETPASHCKSHTPSRGLWVPLGSRMVGREVEPRMMEEAVGPQECPGETRVAIIETVLALGIAQALPQRVDASGLGTFLRVGTAFLRPTGLS